MFVQQRVNQIEKFSTAQYLDQVNRKANRPKLQIYSSNESVARLREQRRIPRQLTSWSAVYHILQRYGAWVAIEKFSNVFQDYKFRIRERPEQIEKLN
jgi:hypothetical protein